MKSIFILLVLAFPVIASAQPATSDLIGLGMRTEHAALLGRENTATWALTTSPTLPTATGTTVADAFQLAYYFTIVGTTPASTGVKLFVPPATGRSIVVRNGGANDLKLYPPNSSGSINSGSAGAGITLTTAAKQIATCTYMTTNTWICSVATGT